MGEHNVSSQSEEREARIFVKSLLTDIAALELMLDTGKLESGVHRIGAEQEMFLIDRVLRPAPVAEQVLERAKEARLTTEIGRFNLEANLSPRLFTGDCLNEMEKELAELLGIARCAAQAEKADVLLAGILPTIRQTDLTLDNLTPSPRYNELNRTLNRLRGGVFNVHIKGLDELQVEHDNLMFEACCSSFQVHLQVGPEEFARLYNIAQLITAPLLAVAANSPLLLGHRLWHETRIALFQHSVDERSNVRQYRGQPPRVSFGDAWLRDSVLEIFREDVARFRVVLTRHIEEDPLAALARGELPQLEALRLHNGTIWRWNRPCYGIVTDNGVKRAHLRIENRVMPAGPTIKDEVANAAFFFGLMNALPAEYGAIDKLMSFEDAKSNFLRAARYGLKTQLTWLGGRDLPVAELILDDLLPLARLGLKQAGINTKDSDEYLGIIEERVRQDQSGALWALRSLTALGEHGTRDQHQSSLTAAMLARQQTGEPVHRWPLVDPTETHPSRWRFETIGDFMTTDLFTVHPDDLVDLAASVMNWKHVRHVPVEDDEGRLVGLVSHRDLLRWLSHRLIVRDQTIASVKTIMKPAPVTVNPQTTTLEAIALMRSLGFGCLPVVEAGRLVGIVTAQDFLNLSADLIEKHLKGNESSSVCDDQVTSHGVRPQNRAPQH